MSGTETGGTVAIEVSPGELIDKITILQIKAERIDDTAKLGNVRLELAVLEHARDQAVPTGPEVARMTAELKAVNEQLWDIEDALRDCEREGAFGARFIELARGVYRTNDRRSELKRALNQALGSRLVEEKSYRPY